MAKENSLTETKARGDSSPVLALAGVSEGSRFLWCILGNGGGSGRMHTLHVPPGMMAGALPLLCLQAEDSVAAHAGSSS